jgi:hypothetical protein
MLFTSQNVVLGVQLTSDKYAVPGEYHADSVQRPISLQFLACGHAHVLVLINPASLQRQPLHT